MPKRTDIKKILIIGAGPIVIGQACEFDYSGTQACKALREEGYEIVLINSNPATIMTDPEIADRTYIEPIRADIIEKIIAREKPCAILPTIGGQTALNMAMELSEKGILDKYNVELIGATLPTIKKAEDRELFKLAMDKIGLTMPKSAFIHSLEEAMAQIKEIGFPAIIRPSFTLAGSGGGIAYNIDEYQEIIKDGLDASPIRQVLVDQSILGWKEYELEVMRDKNDNVVIICSIENIDPMGVHTGDSMTVAPAQTLTDKEYQNLRDMTIKILREIGVDTGGCNVQFAVNPEDGQVMVVEMNPRVSRSSALASKATGFPIAKIAAKLAVGYSLDEIKNDITKETYASFEPTIDYVVTKIPRWAFEKFKAANPVLTTKMKSVGEVMAIGRTFKESFQKALRGLENGRFGFGADGKDEPLLEDSKLVQKFTVPTKDRVFYIRQWFKDLGKGIDELYRLTKIDKWFLNQFKDIVEMEREIEKYTFDNITFDIMKKAKEYGFSDYQLGYLLKTNEDAVREKRKSMNINTVYKMVDTCAAEFKAYTPYLYSSYDSECEANPTKNKKIMILGGGPNRIGQGIEFDYCCCHASFALQEEGYETIMVNSNPETVSTDYDTSDRLYFEPLTKEDVLNIIERENPDGIIVQFGGQTPLNLSNKLGKYKSKIIGTSPESIDMAEDRDKFGAMLKKLDIRQPFNGSALTLEQAKSAAEKIGFPIIVRPSYVLGGRAMEVVYDMESLTAYMETMIAMTLEHPILIDQFLQSAVEVDVDALCDGEDVVMGGIMEHIEEAGIHSGDSACVLPSKSLSEGVLATIREYTKKMALELKVIGLMNVQYAVKDEMVYVLEVNPRASRTSPFVSKATGRPLAKIAAKLMVGRKLKELGITEEIITKYICVKEAVFPFVKFPEVDPKLGPEMRSTGEVMGIDRSIGLSFYKAQYAVNEKFPTKGTVYISVADFDKDSIISVAEGFKKLGFTLLASSGTAEFLKSKGIDGIKIINKINEGRPNIIDYLKNREIDLVINTTYGKNARGDGEIIRRTSVSNGIHYVTTITGALETLQAIKEINEKDVSVLSLQEYYAGEF